MNWWTPVCAPLTRCNFADVKPYKKRLRAAQEATGLDDAILNAVGQLGPHPVVLSAMEYGFIGGSMGAVVGETIARAVDRARLDRKPLIVVAASGGARMMEGVVSLMQMAKISTALAQLDDAKVPYILRAHRSHHRRRHRQLCHAGRPEHRRARRADRFRRPPRYRADHPPKAPRRLPALRISPREGLPRRGGRAPRPESLSDPSFGVLENTGRCIVFIGDSIVHAHKQNGPASLPGHR